MPKYDIHSDDPLEMVWAIREKHYEETKNMTPEEKAEYYRRKADRFLSMEKTGASFPVKK